MIFYTKISSDPVMKRSFEKEKGRIAFEVKRSFENRSDFGNSFFTEEELYLLERTTQSLDFDYGYDDNLMLEYIFSFSHSKRNFSQKEKDFKAQ